MEWLILLGVAAVAIVALVCMARAKRDGDVESAWDKYVREAEERGRQSCWDDIEKKEQERSLRYRQSPRAVISRSEYLSPEDEAKAVHLDSNGLPNARLREVAGRIILSVSGGLINPRSRTLYKTGVNIFKVRGTSYHENANVKADLRPGVEVHLVREPNNEHDPNAIAVHADNVGRIGYVNKLNAKRLAKTLDEGKLLVAHSIDGGRAGEDANVATVLVTTPEIWAHITR